MGAEAGIRAIKARARSLMRIKSEGAWARDGHAMDLPWCHGNAIPNSFLNAHGADLGRLAPMFNAAHSGCAAT